MLKHITNATEFDAAIKEGKVLVDFFATWCGPCKMLSPILEEIDERGEAGDLLIVKVDVDEASDIAMRFNIQSIPTLMLFHSGKIANSALGYMPKPQLLNFLKD